MSFKTRATQLNGSSGNRPNSVMFWGTAGVLILITLSLFAALSLRTGGRTGITTSTSTIGAIAKSVPARPVATTGEAPTAPAPATAPKSQSSHPESSNSHAAKSQLKARAAPTKAAPAKTVSVTAASHRPVRPIMRMRPTPLPPNKVRKPRDKVIRNHSLPTQAALPRAGAVSPSRSMPAHPMPRTWSGKPPRAQPWPGGPPKARPWPGGPPRPVSSWPGGAPQVRPWPGPTASGANTGDVGKEGHR
jgi:hypothetical protein